MKGTEYQGKGGMIVYPREYFVNEDDEFSSHLLALNHLGEECIVFIEPTEENRRKAADSSSAETVPSLVAFAETGRRAQRPCFASADNGPDKSCGIFVLEQVSYEEARSQQFGKPVYSGKWASVLREDDEVPDCMVGKGYLELGFKKQLSAEASDMLLEFQELEMQKQSGQISAIDAAERQESLSARIMADRKKWFVAVFLKPHETLRLPTLSPQMFDAALRPGLTKYTHDGMYGGALIRARKGKVVLSRLSGFCNMQFDYTNGGVKPFEDVFAEFMKYTGNRLMAAKNRDPNIVVEVIPVQRVNCGKLGNDKYAKDVSAPLFGRSSKVMNTYLDRRVHHNPQANYLIEKPFLFADIAVRLAQAKEKKSKGNCLVSSVHAFSAPFGNAFCIDPKGRAVLQMDNAEEEKGTAQHN